MEILKGKVRWIDIVRPTENDFKWLKDNFNFHPIIMDELKVPSARAHVQNYGSYLYLVYHFPVYDPKEKVSRRNEIDFLITKKEIITVGYEEIEVLKSLKKLLAVKDNAPDNVLQFTHKILEALLNFQLRQLTHVREKVDVISEELFHDRESQREKGLLEKISYLKRDISQYRIIVRPQKHIFESMFDKCCGFLGPSCEIYVNDLVGEHIKILDQLDDYKEAVDDFESTNNQLISIKNAQVVKTFTILAFLTFPMMLFAALFSMNTRNTPIVELAYGFWVILGIMLLAMVGMYRYFKKKDWI